MVKICPKCGKSNKNKLFVGAFCIDCKPINIEPPTKLVVYKCKDCGKLRIKNKWVPFSVDKIEKEIARITKGNFEDLTLDLKNNVVTYLVNAGGHMMDIEKPVIVNVRKDLCPICSRRHGGYFEAIVQIRGPDEKVDKKAKKLFKLLNKKTFINKIEEQKNGIDLYVGDKVVVAELLKKLKIKYLKTSTLHTEIKGKRIYRDTFLIRL